MRILFLSQRVPYPPNRGDKITTWRLIERMARTHEVHVAAFETDDADREGALELRRMGFQLSLAPLPEGLGRLMRLVPMVLTGRALTLGWYGSRALQAQVDAIAPGCDLAYAFSSSMGAFIRSHPDLARVMHFAELDSDKWRQYADRERFPRSAIYGREARTLRRFETKLAREFDENVFCTPLEQRIFQEAIPGAPSMVLRNGVDLGSLGPAPQAVEPDHLAFVGVMDYLPNVDGVRWFANEILPKIRARRPGVRLSIVGSKPVPEVLELGTREGIEVTGFVDDPADWLHRTAVSIAPLRIARGIQNKVLEAMAMGLPIVGTTSATQGTGATPGEHFLLAEEPESFAASVLQLLDDPASAANLGAAGRAFVEAEYDWERVLSPLDDILGRLVPSEGP